MWKQVRKPDQVQYDNIKITPDEGYQVAVVTINSRNVCSVSECTFRGTVRNYTFVITFKEFNLYNHSPLQGRTSIQGQACMRALRGRNSRTPHPAVFASLRSEQEDCILLRCFASISCGLLAATDSAESFTISKANPSGS